MISKRDAEQVAAKLLNSPIAPGGYSAVINVGTDPILDSLEENYFTQRPTGLADGISCFKYLEGDYGTGKTQFIHSLAERAYRNGVASSIVSIGEECPFNSPLAIYKALMGGFVTAETVRGDEQGLAVVIDEAIRRRLREAGVEDGASVPDEVRSEIEFPLKRIALGASDSQTAVGLALLARLILGIHCGDVPPETLVNEVISWLRGDKVVSKQLRERGLVESANDQNAFKRLKTVIAFLRKRLSVRGVFVAFDEGTRTNAFRRGTTKQRQAIENLLTMINENSENGFAGVMFLYAATQDFRSDVISKYTALNDRIGSVAFDAGSPMVPLISLDSLITDELLDNMAQRLREVFGVAREVAWDEAIQRDNARRLLDAQKRQFMYTRVPPRVVVYQYCRFLDQQVRKQARISDDEALRFVGAHDLATVEADA